MLPRNCHWLWTDVGQDHKYDKPSQERDVFRYDFTCRSRCSTTRRHCDRSWHPPVQVRHLRHPSSNLQTDTSAKHPDSSFRYLQQPATTIRETATHLRFSRLISLKSVGASKSHRFLSFHTDIIFRTDCDVTMRLWRNNVFVPSRCVTMRYNTLRRNQNLLQR